MAKIMILPSSRSKFINDEHMNLLYKVLLIVSAFMVLQNIYLYGFMFGAKLALMILVSIVLTIETEILFYSHDKNISRVEAKELISKSYPKIMALLYVLLIPIGTPLWLVGLGAVLATLLGKLLFGGFHHMIFHGSLVGVILVTMGWQQIVKGVAFVSSFDNYLIELAFGNKFFTEVLHLGGIFDPSNLNSALSVYGSSSMYSLANVFFGLTPGLIASAFVLLVAFVFLIIKKAIHWIVPVTAIVAFLVTAFIVFLTKGYMVSDVLYYIFSGSFLFIVIFITSDPITTPVPLAGKIIFGLIVGSLTVFIREADVYEEGVIFAVLLMNMLTPLLNETLKTKKAVPQKAVEQNG